MKNPEEENNSSQPNIPEQKQGSEMNAVEKVVFSSEEKAKAHYALAKRRLLEVNKWYEISEVPISTFKLTGRSGEEVERTAQEGDYLKINIPGPGTAAGDGYDWVIIEQIREETINQEDLITMTVRPASSPKNKGREVAHFLKNTATSTFQVKRSGNVVSAEEHGRNEEANSNTGHPGDNIRNTLVGWAAKIGFSYPQWKSLVKGLVKEDS